MTSSTEAADRFVDHMIATWDFGQWELKVLHRLRLLTFRVGRVARRIPRDYYLARLANIPDNKIAGVLALLEQKKVVTITRPVRRRGPRKKGADPLKESRGDRYAIVTEPALWNWILIKPRFEDTEELRKLYEWLLLFDPDERGADPNQPELLPAEKDLTEALQETSVDNAQQNLPRHGAAGPDMGGAGHLDRSGPAGDALLGNAGDKGSRRGSAHMQRSVPEVQADPVAGSATPPHWGPEPAPEPVFPPGSGAIQVKTVCDPETSPKRRFSPAEPQHETSLLGRFCAERPEIPADLKPPKKGGFDALRVSEVLVSSKLSSDPDVQFEHPKTFETLKEGGSKGETKPPQKGGLVLPALRAPGAKVTYKNEDEFLRERARPALGDDYANWGGFVRNRYRENPEVTIHAVDDLIVRLDNPKPIYSRGRWLRDTYIRLSIQYAKIRRGKSAD